MSRKPMTDFNPEHLMDDLRRRVHKSKKEKFAIIVRIAQMCDEKATERTVQTWFDNGRMPSAVDEKIYSYIHGEFRLPRECDIKKGKAAATDLPLVQLVKAEDKKPDLTELIIALEMFKDELIKVLREANYG